MMVGMNLKEGQEITVKPDLFCQRKRKGRVFGFSTLGGWCRGTGKEIKRNSKDRIVFVEIARKTKPAFPTYFAYAESFLTS